jgi:lipase
MTEADTHLTVVKPQVSPLFVSTFGTGRPVLCLHGVESHGLRYVGLAARVGGIQVVAPDLRGHGRSPKVGPWTVEQHLEDLLPILRALGPAPVVMGHSYGGLLAWELARSAPSDVGTLVLVDPAINVSEQLARASVTYEYSSVGHSWADEAAAFAEFAAGKPTTGMWAAALDVAVALARGDDGRVRSLVAPDAVTAGWRQMHEPLRATMYRGPTLLIEAGREEGRYVSASVIAQMRSQLGEALEHVIVDATHGVPSDYPDVLAAAVEPFLASVAAASE